MRRCSGTLGAESRARVLFAGHSTQVLISRAVLTRSMPADRRCWSTLRLQPYEIVGEMWQSVGPSYRDIWAAYAQALKDGRTDRSLRIVGYPPRTGPKSKTAIGLGFEQVLRRYQPVCLALWRRRNASRPIDDFHSEWSKQARAVEIGTRLAGVGTTYRRRLNWRVHKDEPAGSLSLLD